MGILFLGHFVVTITALYLLWGVEHGGLWWAILIMAALALFCNEAVRNSAKKERAQKSGGTTTMNWVKVSILTFFLSAGLSLYGVWTGL